MPELRKRECRAGKDATCLTTAQVGALSSVYAGAKNGKGERLYAPFPWDGGMANGGWRVWKIGILGPNGQLVVPALNAAMGAPALATIFSTPARALGSAPDAGLNFALNYDFDRDAPKIFNTAPGFPRSAWADISARSSDLRGFVRGGAKMIVPHGVSDPVFSINDTIDWWNEVNRRNGGRAASFVRVFPVPGMAHCNGGPATDQYDAFAALVRWVEAGNAPDRIEAAAGSQSPWPGRTRPLCPYPLIARSVPGGDPERSAGFVCKE